MTMILNVEQINAVYERTASIGQYVSNLKQVVNDSALPARDRVRATILLRSHYENTDTALADKYLKIAKRLRKDQSDPSLDTVFLHIHAMQAYQRGNIRAAIRDEREVLRIASESGLHFRVCFANHFLGSLALDYGDSEAGLAQLMEALSIANDRGFLRQKVSILQKIIEAELFSGKSKSARARALTTIEILSELGLDRLMPRAQLQLASIELELGDHAAVQNILDRLHGVVPNSNRSLLSVMHTLRGQVLKSKRKYEAAITECRAALALADYPNAERVRSNIHLHLAELYLKTKKYQHALKEAMASLKDAETANDAFCRREALRKVHDIYKALGKYKQAHAYLERYNEIVAESDTALLRNRLEYHALKTDFEKERVKSQEKTRQSELLRIELEHKERELTEKTKHLIKQTEALVQFRDDLRAIIRRTPADDPQVRQIKERLHALPESQINWQDFDSQFGEIHPEFIVKLKTRFPKLTPMEQKICSLLRLNFTSPDIAKLLFLSERNIQNHRYRIRKKLCLATEANMHEFMMAM